MRRLATLLPIAVLAGMLMPARAAVKFTDVKFVVSDGIETNHLTLLKPALNTVHHAPGMESWLLLPLLPA